MKKEEISAEEKRGLLEKRMKLKGALQLNMRGGGEAESSGSKMHALKTREKTRRRKETQPKVTKKE